MSNKEDLGPMPLSEQVDRMREIVASKCAAVEFRSRLNANEEGEDKPGKPGRKPRMVRRNFRIIRK